MRVWTVPGEVEISYSAELTLYLLQSVDDRGAENRFSTTHIAI